MAYATTSPPMLMMQTIGLKTPRVWMYISADAASLVRVTGYFTDGGTKLGMQDGDLLFGYCTASKIWSTYTVTRSGTTIDLSDATIIGSTTNSD